MNTPIDSNIIDRQIEKLGVKDFSKATIREIVAIAAGAEQESGKEFIKMEMGIPGLAPCQYGVQAQIEALQNGIAQFYPNINGLPELKYEMARFVKAFLDVDISPYGCVPVAGSMQGTYASFLTSSQAKDGGKILFIDPGFPVQKQQCVVMGVDYETFDVYDFRGEKLGPKLESYLEKGDIAAIIYSNPNNPSWTCLNESELKTIGELATKYDIVVLEDLAYFAMDFRRDMSTPFKAPFQSTVAKYTGNYVLLISGSKAFSYAGERIAVACISDHIYNKVYPNLAKRYGNGAFGSVFIHRVLYALSSGTSHSAQYALGAMLKAASDGLYDFRKEVSEYGRRAKLLKEVFLRHGFHIVYDKDLDEQIADGFYFTVGYRDMRGAELAKTLLYYGASAMPLDSTGSSQQGLRICTSFITDEQIRLLDERLAIFEKCT
ncbi:MAG: pyridoxal phosphate-dependent aminotransferase, partial [Prevotellaceae bacterium]|nr:pyridoxal phosphate-dependent aminotransferase [Prevotellaceae bacterium]